MRAVALFVSCLVALSFELVRGGVPMSRGPGSGRAEPNDGYYATSEELGEFYERVGACFLWCGRAAFYCLMACLGVHESPDSKFKCREHECMMIFPNVLENGYRVRFESGDQQQQHEYEINAASNVLCINPEPQWMKKVKILDHRNKTKAVYPLGSNQLPNIKSGGIIVLNPFP